jgi:hypothetical protein
MIPGNAGFIALQTGFSSAAWMLQNKEKLLIFVIPQITNPPDFAIQTG